MFKFFSKKGKEVTLLNPSEKAAKYADELRNGTRYTNDGKYKTDENGVVLGLNDTQKSYRSGYLDARRDSAKAYKASLNKNKGKRKNK